MLNATDQVVHCAEIQVSSQQKFYVSFVYGVNSIAGRIPLWQNFTDMAQSLYDPWCVVRDFNSVFNSGERMGGDEIQLAEITDFTQCLRDCDLHEINTTGVFFTWTNKTIWSKIDRVLVNSILHQGLGYTHVQSLTEGLPNHVPLKINFPSCQKRRQIFRLCEMWTFDPLFKNLVTQHWAK